MQRWEELAYARQDGKEEGREEGKLLALYDLVKKGLLTLGDAAAEMKLTEEIFQEKCSMLKQ